MIITISSIFAEERAIAEANNKENKAQTLIPPLTGTTFTSSFPYVENGDNFVWGYFEESVTLIE